MGFFFLTVSLGLGILLAHSAWEENWMKDPKPWIAFGTWILYAVALGMRRRRGWQGDRVALVNLLAFASVVLGSVLAHAVVDTAHHFGGPPS